MATEFNANGYTREEQSAMLDLVLHYLDEYGPGATGSDRAKRALLRRMLIDLGVELDVVYGEDNSTDEARGARP
jgi:hypothetical protein